MRKLDKTIEPRQKHKALPNNIKFNFICNSNNDIELGLYWHNSLDSLE